jgi:hypothetical protein
MAGSGINYQETYFEFPELTKIHGEPNSETLFQLRNQLKANAQAVYSNLSDGAHGHLTLVLTAAQYALITNSPFIRPAHPGTLLIPPGTTGPMITATKEAHFEQLRLFREVQGVEKALIQQVVKAIDPSYLAALRDRNSNSLRGTVSQILEHLQTVYGRVSPQMLENREQELRTMLYNPKFPIDMVYNAVEDFVDYAALSGQPVSQLQTISKAYIILNKTGRFKQPITEWNRLPTVQKTWINFKDHFRQAHQEFRETTDVTLEESELERNNANLVQQVVDGLSTVLQEERTTEEASVISQMANSTAESQSQLTAQLSEMQKTMALLQAQVQSQSQQYTPAYVPRGGGQSTGGYRGGGQGGGGRGRGRGHYRQRNYSKYCWTHGGCGHLGSTCNAKLPGHQDTASFTDKMGGSSNNCPSS